MDDYHDTSMIDPQLESMFENLRSTPERDPRVVNANRARFESHLDATLAEIGRASFQARTTKVDSGEGAFASFRTYLRQWRLAFLSAVTVLVMGIALIGGAGVTVSTAQAALPGDALYPIKTGWEQTQVRLAKQTYDQAELSMNFAQVRLNEAASLIESGRYDDISLALSEFDAQVQFAFGAVDELSQRDPEQAARLMIHVTDQLSQFVGTLTIMLAQVPEPTAAEMARTLRSSNQFLSTERQNEIEIVGMVEAVLVDALVVDGQTIRTTDETEMTGAPAIGDFVHIQAMVEADGALAAREVTVIRDDDAGGKADDALTRENQSTGSLEENRTQEEGGQPAEDDDGDEDDGGHEDEDDRDTEDAGGEKDPGEEDDKSQ